MLTKPFRYEPQGDADYVTATEIVGSIDHFVVDGDGAEIACLDSQEDAEDMVKRINSHDALVEAAKFMVQTFGQLPDDYFADLGVRNGHALGLALASLNLALHEAGEHE